MQTNLSAEIKMFCISHLMSASFPECVFGDIFVFVRHCLYYFIQRASICVYHVDLPS